MTKPQALEIPYRWDGVEDEVRVEVAPDDEPAALGCPEYARGFPYCDATLKAKGRGYRYLRGWIQLVDESSDGGGFRIDQYPACSSAWHPCCYVGYSCGFFDGPFSDLHEDWDFLAHTFLCAPGGKHFDRHGKACAILGFSWGFSQRGRRVESFGPDLLSAAEWNSHRDYLKRARPAWDYAPGFLEHPPDR